MGLYDTGLVLWLHTSLHLLHAPACSVRFTGSDLEIRALSGDDGGTVMSARGCVPLQLAGRTSIAAQVRQGYFISADVWCPRQALGHAVAVVFFLYPDSYSRTWCSCMVPVLQVQGLEVVQVLQAGQLVQLVAAHKEHDSIFQPCHSYPDSLLLAFCSSLVLQQDGVQWCVSMRPHADLAGGKQAAVANALSTGQLLRITRCVQVACQPLLQVLLTSPAPGLVQAWMCLVIPAIDCRAASLRCTLHGDLHVAPSMRLLPGAT